MSRGVLHTYRPGRSPRICVCGRAAEIDRSGTPMCLMCARAPAAEVEALAKPVVDERLEAARSEAFAILCMATGHQKARGVWREQYADLIPQVAESDEIPTVDDLPVVDDPPTE